MKYLALIQARCGSTRLPNKVLMDLSGKPALLRMLERVKVSKYLDEIIVVTSIGKENLPIVEVCAREGYRVGIGAEEDVLDRFYQTAKLLKPEYVVRLTADCPLFDAVLLDNAIELLNENTDYCAMLTETLADGLDFEIMRFEALKMAWEKSDRSHQREHVTAYITEHPELFRLQDYISPIGDFGNHRWTIDEPEDYTLVSNIYNHFLSNGTISFGYKDVLEYLEKYPKLIEINNKFKRNEGYEKSLREDEEYCLI